MEQTRRTYLAWLHDAHAMEQQALTMMEGQLSRLDTYPDLRAQLQLHIAETREQAATLDRLLARQGSDASLMKDTMGRPAAMGQSLVGLFAADEVVKSVLAAYTFEQMEIASYRTLITAAEQMGDLEAIEVFTRSLDQEEAMAGWLAGHSAEITRKFLARAEVDLPSHQ